MGKKILAIVLAVLTFATLFVVGTGCEPDRVTVKKDREYGEKGISISTNEYSPDGDIDIVFYSQSFEINFPVYASTINKAGKRRDFVKTKEDKTYHIIVSYYNAAEKRDEVLYNGYINT